MAPSNRSLGLIGFLCRAVPKSSGLTFGLQVTVYSAQKMVPFTEFNALNTTFTETQRKFVEINTKWGEIQSEFSTLKTDWGKTQGKHENSEH